MRSMPRRPQDFHPRIHITDSDFVSITDDGRLCDENGQLGPAEFEAVIRRQVRITSLGERILSLSLSSLPPSPLFARSLPLFLLPPFSLPPPFSH